MFDDRPTAGYVGHRNLDALPCETVGLLRLVHFMPPRTHARHPMRLIMDLNIWVAPQLMDQPFQMPKLIGIAHDIDRFHSIVLDQKGGRL